MTALLAVRHPPPPSQILPAPGMVRIVTPGADRAAEADPIPASPLTRQTQTGYRTARPPVRPATLDAGMTTRRNSSAPAGLTATRIGLSTASIHRIPSPAIAIRQGRRGREAPLPHAS